MYDFIIYDYKVAYYTIISKTFGEDGYTIEK